MCRAGRSLAARRPALSALAGTFAISGPRYNTAISYYLPAGSSMLMVAVLGTARAAASPWRRLAIAYPRSLRPATIASTTHNIPNIFDLSDFVITFVPANNFF